MDNKNEYSKRMGEKIRDKVTKEKKESEIHKESNKRYETLKERVGEIKVGEMCVITTKNGKETIDKVKLVDKERVIERLEKPSIEIPVIIINGKASKGCLEMLQEALIKKSPKVLACPEGLVISKIVITNDV